MDRELSELFTSDVGTLPDIYIENLTSSELGLIYNWIRSITTIYGSPTLWLIEEQKDVLISEFENPVSLFLENKCKIFRHSLTEFSLDGIIIPQLTISIESSTSLSFDYRMGPKWGFDQINALFKFLFHITKFASNAIVYQTFEGEYNKPNVSFTSAFAKFCEM
ncbi:hypothetical protein [Leptospira koniambonensis]|uniref:hypothetical protein n=1 Tax=Leptospira koniambonensis TaxID=2484950 RepID=UPI003EBC505A